MQKGIQQRHNIGEPAGKLLITVRTTAAGENPREEFVAEARGLKVSQGALFERMWLQYKALDGVGFDELQAEAERRGASPAHLLADAFAEYLLNHPADEE